MSAPTRPLDADALRALGQAGGQQPCSCPLGPCAGWESLTEARWPAAQMSPVGSLRQVTTDPTDPTDPTHLTNPEAAWGAEPSFEEFHPAGTRYDSPQAPIAPGYFPYNRCDAFACGTCHRVLLKYTEFGGYYVDHRVRALLPEWVVDAGVPDAAS